MEKEIMLLQAASTEIKTLRANNRYQSGRLQMFDDMMLLLRTAPGYGASQGMSPDLVFEIDRFIDSENEKQSQKTI